VGCALNTVARETGALTPKRIIGRHMSQLATEDLLSSGWALYPAG